MNSFSVYNPTKVVFGAETVRLAGEEVKKCGGTRPLVLYGGGSAVRNGLLDKVTSSLREAGLTYRTAGGIQPNPRAELAQKITDDCRDKGVDFIIGVGGGSVLDTAKAVAHGLACPEVPVWDYFCQRRTVAASLPVCAIPTIAAAGSETSDSAVLTNQASGEKRGLGTPFNRPRLAILDPVLTLSLPLRQTACGVADILMHTLERYFAPDADNAVTDALAEALMRVVIEYGKVVMRKPDDYKARSELLWAGSLSHNGLTGLGQRKDFSAHQLGHALSARYDIPHGESLTAIWPAWAKTVYKDDVRRFARYAGNVWSVIERDDDAAALAGIEATTAFFRFLGLPVTLTEAAGSHAAEELDILTDLCSYHGTRTIGSFRILDEAGIRSIYQAAL